MAYKHLGITPPARGATSPPLDFDVES